MDRRLYQNRRSSVNTGSLLAEASKVFDILDLAVQDVVKIHRSMPEKWTPVPDKDFRKVSKAGIFIFRRKFTRSSLSLNLPPPISSIKSSKSSSSVKKSTEVPRELNPIPNPGINKNFGIIVGKGKSETFQEMDERMKITFAGQFLFHFIPRFSGEYRIENVSTKLECESGYRKLSSDPSVTSHVYVTVEFRIRPWY